MLLCIYGITRSNAARKAQFGKTDNLLHQAAHSGSVKLIKYKVEPRRCCPFFNMPSRSPSLCITSGFHLVSESTTHAHRCSHSLYYSTSIPLSPMPMRRATSTHRWGALRCQGSLGALAALVCPTNKPFIACKYPTDVCH